jgi:hypothetical protein
VHGGGNGSILEGNEIDYNNPDRRFDPGWEAGGSKFASGVSNLLIKNNYVHHNEGPGLWTDIRGNNITYEGNIVEYNVDIAGLFHEISYSATIRCNISRNNCSQYRDWLFNGQIQVSTSNDVEIYYNTVLVPAGGGNGICIVNQNRGGGWFARDCYVHHNDITYLDDGGITGVACDFMGQEYFDQANVRFDYNNYHAERGDVIHWETHGGWRDWADFRRDGQEPNGTLDNDLTADIAYCDECAEIWDGHPFLEAVQEEWNRESKGADAAAAPLLGVSQRAGGDIGVVVRANSSAVDLCTLDGRRIVRLNTAGRTTVTVPTSSLPSGVYVVSVIGRHRPLSRTVVLR